MGLRAFSLAASSAVDFFLIIVKWPWHQTSGILEARWVVLYNNTIK